MHCRRSSSHALAGLPSSLLHHNYTIQITNQWRCVFVPLSCSASILWYPHLLATKMDEKKKKKPLTTGMEKDFQLSLQLLDQTTIYTEYMLATSLDPCIIWGNKALFPEVTMIIRSYCKWSYSDHVASSALLHSDIVLKVVLIQKGGKLYILYIRREKNTLSPKQNKWAITWKEAAVVKRACPSPTEELRSAGTAAGNPCDLRIQHATTAQSRSAPKVNHLLTSFQKGNTASVKRRHSFHPTRLRSQIQQDYFRHGKN